MPSAAIRRGLSGGLPLRAHRRRAIAPSRWLRGAGRRRLCGLAGWVLAGMLWSLTAMAIEEPAFTVAEREPPFELRDYAPYVVAETFIEGAFDAVGNAGFRRLFRYISGRHRGAHAHHDDGTGRAAGRCREDRDDRAGRAAARRRAVARRVRAAGVLHRLATAPQPTDGARSSCERFPARRMAVISDTSGTWSEARYDENLGALLAPCGRPGTRPHRRGPCSPATTRRSCPGSCAETRYRSTGASGGDALTRPWIARRRAPAAISRRIAPRPHRRLALLRRRVGMISTQSS